MRKKGLLSVTIQLFRRGKVLLPDAFPVSYFFFSSVACLGFLASLNTYYFISSLNIAYIKYYCTV